MDKLPFAVTLASGSSTANTTGAWRSQRPVFVRDQAPCGGACPAGEDVQAWLYWAEEGAYEIAWNRIIEDNPFPAIMGRVCYAPCEGACNRAQLDTAVNINAVERFLGDVALGAGWELPPVPTPSGRRVLIVGAGPAGLSAAYHLARRGHAVTVYEAAPQAGGMMRYGIPTYRLPRDVLDAEVARIAALGVQIECDHPVDDLDAELLHGGFNAALLAVGAQLPTRVEIPAGSAARMIDAIGLLHGMESGERPQLGRRVVVYGGGNTAMDAARTAERLGAEDPVIVYRRTQAQMPAHPSELEQAEAEGVTVRWLSTIARAEAGHITIERMELDETGFPQPTGEFEELAADSVILALGQQADLDLIADLGGIDVGAGGVAVGADLMTSRRGVFASGDVTPATRTVTHAVGQGKRAAQAIEAWLTGVTYEPDPPRPLAGFDRLNPWYYEDAPATVREQLDRARRRTSFDEVVQGLDARTALFEARRCLSCGNCLACDNCYSVCPDNAVLKLDPPGAYAYAFDLDYCKGCGLCATECPCGAIDMVDEVS